MCLLDHCQEYFKMVRDWTSYNCQSEDIINHLLLYNLDHVVLQIFRLVQSSFEYFSFHFQNVVNVETLTASRYPKRDKYQRVGEILLVNDD